MTDTNPEIARKQLEIILLKSESERFRICDDWCMFGRKIVESSIRDENPGMSEIDLTIEVFKRCYTPFFSPDELKRIILSMKDYLQKEKLTAI